jgi:hypothetical protein
MKNLFLFLALLFSTYCFAQKKIILTTGDTIIGKVISENNIHTSIETVDGKQLLIANNLIKSIDGKASASEIEKVIQSSKDSLTLNQKASDNLIAASSIHNKSVAIIVVGIVITIAGILILPELATASAIVGGVFILGGGIYSCTAWNKIKAAGVILKRQNL